MSLSLLFDTFWGCGGDASPKASPSKAAAGAANAHHTELKVQTKVPKTTAWFDVAALSRKTPAAEVLNTPPHAPIRLGSDFTGYGTDSLACHYLGLNYTVAFVAEKSAVKETLRKALQDHVTCKTPKVKYGDVRRRCTKDAPACDVFIAGPPCVCFSSLGKKQGIDASPGRLLYHSLLYIVEKLPRLVIIENVRGLTFRRHAWLLQHVKDCLQGVGYTLHVRILCTSQSGVPQSRGRCYLVGVRSPKAPFKWPRTLPVVKLENFLDARRINLEHPLNRRQQTLMRKLQTKHKGRLEKHWFSFDAGASLRYVQCCKDRSPCLTRARAGGHYVPKLRRFLSLLEHGSLQGLPRRVTLHMAEAVGGGERAVRAALGDAMSLNVLMRVLGNALYSAGLVGEVPADPWRQMAKDVQQECNLGGCSKVKLDTYLERAGRSR